MLSKEIIKYYEEYWQNRISDIDYSDIDMFCESHDLSDDEIDELFYLIPSVNFSNDYENEEDNDV